MFCGQWGVATMVVTPSAAATRPISSVSSQSPAPSSTPGKQVAMDINHATTSGSPRDLPFASDAEQRDAERKIDVACHRQLPVLQRDEEAVQQGWDGRQVGSGLGGAPHEPVEQAHHGHRYQEKGEQYVTFAESSPARVKLVCMRCAV